MICDFLVFSLNHEGGMEGIPMRKMICDRCGEEIDVSYMDRYDVKPAAICKVFGKKSSLGLVEPTDLEYELCDNCANKLVVFLKG